ncbi:uncharacterized protein Z519_00010 [Cladophialophora bantiana CBS 173.52]|uniref:Uncharacterized protein n=1 Tax=Cladophialophora bantiana (strain ATCC 10958 / CBS 173.52 / CDC B-1940 / NIH 8579) TaxID=1442370 RepID=A0A0D2I4Z3_CLAB1|nr:uncharacterized protein Z519_00010 [Cladophialophora bantiana CBS 173.52]KIW98350.1 hypothetical protein Z519_00010 [Cladophialophora bantiana CBS 173.52]
MSSQRLDTSCVRFELDKEVRSPRTPTYIPDSLSSSSVSPFDHTKYFAEPTLEGDDQEPMSIAPQQHPMPWTWICHLCHSRYPLGVTRRCLVDGHYYCSGQTDWPSLKRKKKPRACSSEFDYAAWKNWGAWRRGTLKILQNERVLKGCESCDFPSQCRYPVDSHPLSDAEAALVYPNASVSETLQELEAKIEERRGKSEGGSNANENVGFDQILKNICPSTKSQTPGSQKLSNTKQQNKSMSRSKEKRSVKGPIRAWEEEAPGEEKRLRELVGPDLWSCLEDVGLDNGRIG